ncbi:MAG: hypothetical protein IJG80_07240, partial [Selenomonadaceae bacterium]|nr:hypothetical protein [Selenomonadaceae bacterium]
MDKLKVIFMGTPDFAVPSLAALVDKTEVICVVTQPDKPKGRGHKLQPPPVKIFAEENNLRVIQPPKVKARAVVDELAALHPDLIVVVAFGQILSQKILDIPRFGCINVHASLLPKYRGAAPIEWSIIRGEKVTGITTMQMNAGLDTGDILLLSGNDIIEHVVEIHAKHTVGHVAKPANILDGRQAGIDLFKISRHASCDREHVDDLPRINALGTSAPEFDAIRQ